MGRVFGLRKSRTFAATPQPLKDVICRAETQFSGRSLNERNDHEEPSNTAPRRAVAERPSESNRSENQQAGIGASDGRANRYQINRNPNVARVVAC